MLKFLPIAACLALGAVPALASADSQPATDEDQEMVCKRIDGTGWRLSRANKVCMTKAEWRRATEEAQREARRYGRKMAR